MGRERVFERGMKWQKNVNGNIVQAMKKIHGTIVIYGLRLVIMLLNLTMAAQKKTILSFVVTVVVN